MAVWSRQWLADTKIELGLLRAGVTVHELGHVCTGSGIQQFGCAVNNTYHYQYPVGYKAVMQVQDRSKRCQAWTLEVQLVDDAPRFQVGCRAASKEHFTGDACDMHPFIILLLSPCGHCMCISTVFNFSFLNLQVVAWLPLHAPYA